MNTELVSDSLRRHATDDPNRPAIWVPSERINLHGETQHIATAFGDLNHQSDALACGMYAIGLQPGDRVALMVPPCPAFFALTFALLKSGIVPVMIDPGMGVASLGQCLAESEPVGFIGVPKAHLARRLLGWAKNSVRVTVNVGKRRFFCTASLNEVQQRGSSEPTHLPTLTASDTSAILFTSGSTGLAKGVVYTQGIFAEQVQLLRTVYGIAPGEVDLCTFPLFALFGPALGMTCVIPQMNASRPATLQPLAAVSQIRQFRVTNLFGSPAVVRNLAHGESRGKPVPYDRAAVRIGLQSLRRVISAGAPARPDVLEQLQDLLPESTEIFTPYGATEALPVSNIGSRAILGTTRQRTEQGDGVCVGKLVPGVSVKVIRISNEAYPTWAEATEVQAGEIGEFVVGGAITTQEYYRREEATRMAKIVDPQSGLRWHRMGDVGWIDDDGQLWFCGRKSHRVVLPSGTLFTDQVEPIFNRVPGVQRTALVAAHDATTDSPVAVVCVEAKHFTPTVLELLTRQKQSDPRLSAINCFLHYPGVFPVDVRHNSKIFREKLAVWATKYLSRKEGVRT